MINRLCFKVSALQVFPLTVFALFCGMTMLLVYPHTLGANEETIFTFEDLAGPLAGMPDPYQIIHWENGSGWFHYDVSQPPYNPHSGIVRISSETLDKTPSWRFTTPVTFKGAWFAGHAFATIEFHLFDSAGNLLFVSPVYAPSEVPTFFASGYSDVVDRVEIHTPRPGYWVLDDLTFALPDEPPPPAFLPVVIDVKPGNGSNTTNGDAEGMLSVAILTTRASDGDAFDFDVATVDQTSLTLQGVPVHVRGESSIIGIVKDVDHDGDDDLIAQFPIGKLGLTGEDTSVVLEGQTFEGIPFHGADSITIVP